MRHDILREVLADIDRRYECHFESFYPKNSFINELYHNYDAEVSEMWYDSEPKYDDGDFEKYLDYMIITDSILPVSGNAFFELIINEKEILENKNFRFQSKESDMNELKAAYDRVIAKNKDYEEERLRWNNWVNWYADGQWGLTQHDCDEMAREHLRDLKNFDDFRNRFYIAHPKWNKFYIFYFGRDRMGLDYEFEFTRKEDKYKRQ